LEEGRADDAGHKLFEDSLIFRRMRMTTSNEGEYTWPDGWKRHAK